MSKPTLTFGKQFPAIQLKHQGNVLHCCVEGTAEKNFEIIRKAYTLLVGFDYFQDNRSRAMFTDEGGVIEAYRAS